MKAQEHSLTYWQTSWRRFLQHRLGSAALGIVFLFCFTGLYAPFLASSKPFVVIYDGRWYFPLFRYLLYPGFFTKKIDLFFNTAALLSPLFFLGIVILRRSPRFLKPFLLGMCGVQAGIFAYLILYPIKDPGFDAGLASRREAALRELRSEGKTPGWDFELEYMTDYEKLNQILRYRQRLQQHERIVGYVQPFYSDPVPTLWQMESDRDRERVGAYVEQMREHPQDSSTDPGKIARARQSFLDLKAKRAWLKQQNDLVTFIWMPLVRPFHWEDDVGGEQKINQHLPWWELTRINRKDLVAALIFGIRISLVVGILAVSLAMLIGVPIGAYAGYYGGTVDMIVSRLLEIWESMPTFFMLLLVVAMLQNKSIFIVIAVVGIFGWPGFSRYVRGEFFKHRNLPYVEASHALGFNDRHIMFSHILPNAISPVLTLLPFAILGAISSEAGLSFLGLGEEGSCSWGVLMDEGRTAFPEESYLLWPPATLLTVLLVSIALVGDAVRDVLDPKMHR